jgi:hypothetical protein
MSLRDDSTFVEVFFMNRAACLWGDRIDVDANSTITVHQGPGLRYKPDVTGFRDRPYLGFFSSNVVLRIAASWPAHGHDHAHPR